MSTAWLSEALSTFSLTPDVEDYLLGRGTKESTIQAEGIVTWQRLKEPSPDETFSKQCGPHGEKLEGMLVIPARSPKGTLLGFEARSIHEKRIYDFRFPMAKYCPFFLGTRRAMPVIWAGGDVWLVEGFFDLTPLEWALSPKTAILATVRAHITPQQLEFLRRYCKGRVHVAFDMDAVGRKAAEGWVDETGKKHLGAETLLKGVGLRVSVEKYSGGKDPGEIWNSGGEAAIKSEFGRR